jgi:hypothetical protein
MVLPEIQVFSFNTVTLKESCQTAGQKRIHDTAY